MSDEPRQPNWVELAKVVSGRITNRKDVEWKLALQHYGALGAGVAAVGTYYKTTNGGISTPFLALGLLLLAFSFVTSLLWIFLIESAHAFDAKRFRYYSDRANFLPRTFHLTNDADKKWQARHKKLLPCDRFFKWAKSKYKTFAYEQKMWLQLHIQFSILIHLGVGALLLLVASQVPETKEKISEPNVNKVHLSLLEGDIRIELPLRNNSHEVGFPFVQEPNSKTIE
ncbi:MAG: hypothetical protein V4719_18300 [Planctomycetota bacterium]